MPPHASNSQMKAFEARATSLPKISSRVKLTQFQVLDKKGQNSRAALHYKNMSKWDHQNLVDVKGMLEKRQSQNESLVSPSAKRPGQLKELIASKAGLSNSPASKMQLAKLPSDRSLLRNSGVTASQASVQYVPSHPYLNFQNQQEELTRLQH